MTKAAHKHVGQEKLISFKYSYGSEEFINYFFSHEKHRLSKTVNFIIICSNKIVTVVERALYIRLKANLGL